MKNIINKKILIECIFSFLVGICWGAFALWTFFSPLLITGYIFLDRIICVSLALALAALGHYILAKDEIRNNKQD